MNQNQESVLFKASAASDIQCSGGVLTVAGLSGTRKSRISSITQVKSKAEVVQVITIGATSYTPTSGTTYAVEIGDTTRTRNGQAEQLKRYSYTLTASAYTGVAATDRETISVALVAAINADTRNYVVAATLGGGGGFTVTDDAGYYPAFSQTGTQRKGASWVRPVTNDDGSGYSASNYVVTTAAVYASGVGADLAASVPVIDAYCGGLLSGYLSTSLDGISFTTKSTTAASNNLPPVSGQNYDIFVIQSLTEANAHNQRGQLALVPKVQAIAVDNGTGTSTSNLAGFKAFERVMHKHMVAVYASDPSTVQEWFDSPIVFQDPLGAAPTGTADTLGWQLSPYGSLNRTNIGTQTIVAPVLDATGLLIDQDDTAAEGSHTSAYQGALGDQSFIVGKTAFSVTARVVAGDWTDTAFMVGFRKKAVYAADFNDYTDLAAIGGGAADGDSVTTQGILNNAATVATDAAVNFTDAVSALLSIKVDINGTVTAWFNGVSYPIYSAGTTTLVFDAGDEMIPFYQHLNIGGGNPAVSIGEFFAVANDRLIV